MPIPVAAVVGASRLGGIVNSIAQTGKNTALSKALESLGVNKKASAVTGGLANASTDFGFAIGGVKQLIAPVMGLGKAALSLANPLTYVNEAFKVAGMGVDLMLTPLKSLNVVAQTVTGILGNVVEAATGLGNSVKPFVDKANPAYSAQFQFASDAMLASIGTSLIPVMQGATSITRAFADVIYSLSPGFTALNKAFFQPLTSTLPQITNACEPVIGAFNRVNGVMSGIIGPTVTKIVDSLRESFEGVMPAVTAFVDGLGITAEVGLRTLAGTIEVLAFAAKAASYPLTMLTKSLGLSFGGSGPKIANSSLNAGVHNVKFGGVEDFYRDVVKGAFQVGAGPKEPFELGTSYLGEIATWLSKFNPADLPKQIAEAIAKAL